MSLSDAIAELRALESSGKLTVTITVQDPENLEVTSTTTFEIPVAACATFEPQWSKARNLQDVVEYWVSVVMDTD